YDLDTARIKYKEAYQDLWQLTVAVRSRYPSLPLYIIGESLGAGMALRLASDMPDSVDGIVLSSPAIKGRLFISARVVLDTMVVMCYPKREVDLKPYIRQLASESPEVSDSAVTDPLVRKRLTVWDLFRTARLIRGNIKHARTVPATMPVLIIQGDRDRMINSNGVAVLIENLKCTDQTVKWLPGKGHLLLETPLIEDETRNTVTEWILEHSSRVRPVKVSLSN
ncbi:MAG: lysophospholipase, partial [Candidatus Obscuribacterales bacterium]|nr:lysophospholipase [Candidatus Obscuribacterales bacterium]